MRELIPRLHAAWDGGPVKIAGTVAAGDRVAGFGVIHIPGHAPGQIALFREADRLLIAADAIYTLDAETGQPSSARVPHPFSNWNIDEEFWRAADYGLDHGPSRAGWSARANG